MSDKVVNVPLFYSVRDGGANEVRGGSKDFTMGEIIREACSIGDAINAITEIVAIKKQDRFCDCEYYFRGENHNFLTEDGAVPDAHVPTTLYRDKGFVENEHLIFNEIVRTYPDVFRDDKTTFEMLARMQHYYFPTRLMDITSNVMVAMAFSVVKGVNAAKDFLDVPGFIHIYAAKRSKIKYSTGDTVFSGCTGLTSVKLDDGLTVIGESAFSGCTGLTSVTIPSSVTSIGGWAFCDCMSLLRVYYLGNAPEGVYDIYSGDPATLVSYVREGSTGWSSGASTDLPDSWQGRSIAHGEAPVVIDGVEWNFTIVDGKVTISYTPELDDARKAMRKYTTWGKTSLMDTDWTEVQEGRESEYNFFKVSVEMK